MHATAGEGVIDAQKNSDLLKIYGNKLALISVQLVIERWYLANVVLKIVSLFCRTNQGN